MKFNLIALSLLSVTSFANAQEFTPNPGVPGGIAAVDVRCSPTNHMVGFDYGITIFTQSLAPQYNVRGGLFTKTGVFPGAETQKFVMQLTSQDEYSASFFVEKLALTVQLNKSDYSADIYRGRSFYPVYTCGK